MIKLFINNVDYTDDVEDGSLTITDQIQNKANTCSFRLNTGATEPSKFQEVLIYDTVKLVSASGTAVVVQDKLASGLSILTYGKFRAGQFFWLDINGSDEERVEIDSIEAGNDGEVNITLVDAIANSHSADEDCGRLIFGGNISNLTKVNPRLLTDVDYEIQCTDFTKIFDHKLVNDTWEDVDVRYIINDILNTTVNLNRAIDDMDYDDDAAVQAEWVDTLDADNPTVDTSDYLQGTSAVVMPWTYSTGAAVFTATPTSANVSDLTGVTSGLPTEGNITFWLKTSDHADITYFRVRYGSDTSNVVQVVPDIETDGEWHFYSLPLKDGALVGTPDWTAADSIRIRIGCSADGEVLIDDLRITAENSFKPTHVKESLAFDDVRGSFKKPTVFVDKLFNALGWYWYIDYEYNIHGFDREENVAPFDITDSSDNFIDLSVDVDISQLKNRQVVRGGVKTSASTYSEPFVGDNAKREWKLKARFSGLEIDIDDNSSTDTMEVGTTTTNVTATAHGLVTGDYITNRTRSNAVRVITKVDDDNFTVEAVASQTNGDTFSKFDTSKTVGVENLVDETTVDYVSNYNQASIRATDSEDTLTTDDIILFTYFEEVPIRTQVFDPASISTIKALIGGDGIFDGAVITDNSIDSTQGARDRAQAEVDAYANPIITVRFKTNYEGLESGQIVTVTDANKSINDNYIIQKVKIAYKDGTDFPEFSITAASSVFGLIEYFQKLSEQDEERLVDSEEEVDQIFTENVTITIAESNRVNTPDHSASDTDTISVAAVESATERNMTTDPYVWQPDASDARWNLAQWG